MYAHHKGLGINEDLRGYKLHETRVVNQATISSPGGP
jgi:hypothetical protein